MKVQWQIGQALVEAEGDTLQEVIQQLSVAAECLSVGPCDECGAVEIVPRFRQNSGYDFYEMQCTNVDCQATYALGTTKEHRLYPKGPWKRYQGHASDESRAF